MLPILVALGLVFLIGSGIKEIGRFTQLAQKRESLRVSNRQLKEKNEAMVREIARLKNDPLYVEEIARREFGLVKADEIIFYIEDSPHKENDGHDHRNSTPSP